MDFKSLRSDKLKLTQEEFANLYGISIQEVQELDKTGKPDMDLIVKIATKSGLDFNTILSYEQPRVKPISAKDTWEKTNFTKKSLSGYLNSALEQMDIPDDMRKNYIFPFGFSLCNATVFHFIKHIAHIVWASSIVFIFCVPYNAF